MLLSIQFSIVAFPDLVLTALISDLDQLGAQNQQWSKMKI
jgi:hypothetical protein